jgi:hypothetical protein
MKRAAAVMLASLAVALLALLITATYGLTNEYDFVAADLQPVDVMIVLLLGCVALLLLLGARSQVGARRPATAVLAVTVLVVFAGSAAAGAVLGGAAHDRRTATVASACSVEDRELLAGVDFTGYRDGPHGDTDGGCVLNLFPDTETTTVVADLTAALERDGWRAAESGGETLTLERGGAVLTLSTVSDDKTTELVLTLC